jgi:hypothetical protein
MVFAAERLELRERLLRSEAAQVCVGIITERGLL